MFDFELLHAPWSAAAFAAAIETEEQVFSRRPLADHRPLEPRQAAPGVPARADAPARGDERRVARAAAVLALTLRGTPFLYYGEEIGMRDMPVPWSEIIDPPAKRGGRLVRRLVPWWNRDQARIADAVGRRDRTAASRPAGRGCGWRPTSTRGTSRSRPATRRRSSPTYRRLLWLRRRHPALQTGATGDCRSGADDVLAFEREGEAEAIVVAVNFGRAAA